jgi:hypothetical protein
MIAEPPFEPGALKVTVAWAFPGVAVTAVGAPGMVAPLGGADGVAAFDGAEAGPVPTAFVAVTVNVYLTPFVKPVTVNGLAAPVAVSPPGDAVTVYEVIADPPFDAGALNVTVAWPFPAVAAPALGAPGTVGGTDGVTVFDGADAGPVPTLFVAVTVNE